jgi:hypothetical protein
MLPCQILGRRNVHELDLHWPRRTGPGSRVKGDLVGCCAEKAAVQDGLRTGGQSDRSAGPKATKVPSRDRVLLGLGSNSARNGRAAQDQCYQVW